MGYYPDHPRMRGEDSWRDIVTRRVVGSPPHARGRLLASSAADNLPMDHPRMRGEDKLAEWRTA